MERERGISGSTLKIIAAVLMLADHTAAVVLGSLLAWNGVTDVGNYSLEYMGSMLQTGAIGWVYLLYQIMRRLLGRLAFPIYCFLLVEGFGRTRSKRKYAWRLFLFALISEIPFNLAFRYRMFDNTYQNVFFTLLLGFLMMWAMEGVEKYCRILVLQLMADGALLFGTALAAEMLRCDYRAKGIIAIGLLYLFRKNKWEQMVAGCIAFVWEITAPLAFIFIGFYNGRQGVRLKYAFYLFYPVHLLSLYFLARGIIGLGLFG
ncbi:hypothetical protein IMSAGC019_00107 [Lachnospiraceae bacterium]|nr:hypothetical protein IMSAGC019_00107 [Lachnospiraceae bacterium]